MIFDWIPLKRVGPFEFGASIDQFIQSGIVEYLDMESDDSTGWDPYAYDGDAVRVHVDKGHIVSVACYEYCSFREANLIGLDFEAVVKLLVSPPKGPPDTIFINDHLQHVYEFDDVGGQVWVEDGIVVTVFCDDGM